MKQIIIILLFFFVYNSTYAQNNTEIKGKWKPFSAFDGDIYINSKTDSEGLCIVRALLFCSDLRFQQ